MTRFFNLLFVAILLIVSTASPVISSTRHHDEKGVRCSSRGMDYTKDHGRKHQHTIRMVRCLTHEIGGIPGGWPKVRSTVSCESGWYWRATSEGGHRGLFQLGRAEFRTFWHQGPAWVRAEFRRGAWHRHPPIYDPRANALSALSHIRRYGWANTWSCA